MQHLIILMEQNGESKYVGDIIGSDSTDPIADQLKLWDICIFNYLIGNTDNHIKNISLIYSKDMAMSIGGKYNIFDISRESFEIESRNVGLGSRTAMKRFDEMMEKFPDVLRIAALELSQKGLKGVDDICEIIQKKRIPN